jgi:hypothetical protein
LIDLTDRQLIRDLVEAYALGCDRQESAAVAALFTIDGVLAGHPGHPATTEPRYERHGREAITKAMGGLSRYERTHHLLGQQTLTAQGSEILGTTYCQAEHLRTVDGERTMMVMAIIYHDRYVRHERGWLIAERRLETLWDEERTMGPPRS